MKTMISPKMHLLMVASLVLVSCGGDSGGTSSLPTLTGVLVDSPVHGLPYTSSPSGLSGQTGPKGEFQYRQGDSITFVVGRGVQLTTVTARPFITPFALAGNTSITNANQPGPVNLARYLLTLDTTPGTDVLTMPAVLPSIPSNTCFQCGDIEQFMANAGFPFAVSAAEARTHLNKQFAIWGSWATTTSPNAARVFTFLSDGTYLLANDDDPTVPGGTDGMERGTYRWDPNTNVFTYSVAVNTDADGGLSNRSPTQQPPYTFVIDVSGNQAVLRLSPTPQDEIQLTRVIDQANAIVGSWRMNTPFGLSFNTVITFLADGTFLVANDSIDDIPAGIERGTYAYNLGTSTLTVTTTLDTNGEFGFNDAQALPSTGSSKLTINSTFGGFDHMTIGENQDVVLLDRVRAP